MSDRPRSEGWWLAADGKWYPPEAQPTEPQQPGPGWWLASDGNWYPPEARPAATADPETPPGPGWWLASDGNWYPPESRPGASEQPAPGWWLASDGNWYPPEARPGPPPVDTRLDPGAPVPVPEPGAPSAERISRGTSTALRYFLYGASVLALLACVLTLNEVTRFQSFLDGGSRSALIDAEGASETAISWFTLGVFATGVLFIVWTQQAYKAVMALGPTGRRWSPGWAVGAWFVPVANLVLPKLVVNEIDRISNPVSGPPPVGDRWRDADVLTVGSFWWGLWLLGGAVILISSVIIGTELERDLFDPDRYSAGLIMRAIGYGIHFVSALLAARVVKTIGARLDPVKARDEYAVVSP